MYFHKNNKGFTLLEILIALFIFTIVSMILMTALQRSITAQLITENRTQMLRQLQMSLLMISRDIEQIVNRPVTNTSGKEEYAFQGSAQDFVFTHGGYVKPKELIYSSSLKRAGYSYYEHSLVRKTYAVLDQAPNSRVQSRVILQNIEKASFEYLDHKGRFYKVWPPNGSSNESLPKAIRIHLNIAHLGNISQLYVIPAEPSPNSSSPNL